MILLKANEFAEDGLDEMEEILRKAVVGRLALCDSSKPYIVPLNFLYCEGKVIFHCAWEGKKSDLIAQNPDCCFEVDEYMGEVRDHYEAECYLDYDSVLAFGRARVLDDEDEKLRLLKVFSAKYGNKSGLTLTMERARDCCCVGIEIEELTGRRERTVEGKRQKTLWRHRF